MFRRGTCVRIANVDERPPVWVGHIALAVSDVDRSAQWWQSLGLREIAREPQVAIYELRGGTHLVLHPDTPRPGDAPFDLMVDNLEATHAAWRDAGLDPSTIERGRIHASFTVRDPDGYAVTVSNSHVAGPV